MISFSSNTKAVFAAHCAATICRKHKEIESFSTIFRTALRFPLGLLERGPIHP
jgi:hypothetical protein